MEEEEEASCVLREVGLSEDWFAIPPMRAGGAVRTTEGAEVAGTWSSLLDCSLGLTVSALRFILCFKFGFKPGNTLVRLKPNMEM